MEMNGRSNQCGNIIILAALSSFMLFAFAALALDSSLLYVARNELQNAADAGALAGARRLYLNDGTAVNPAANQVAHDAAESNFSQNSAVEVDWTAGNAGDVQRGHWSFATRQFTANASLTPVDLFNATTAELDANVNFINAVKVTARRQAAPVQSIFASLFGIDSSVMETDAVAYIGFAGRIQPTELDQPIAICGDRLRNDAGEYQCNVGTFIPSNDAADLGETGGWSSFSQENACQGGTSTSEVRPLICGSGNPQELFLGEPLATLGGQANSAYEDFWNCWDSTTTQSEPWNMTLPVVTCNDNNVGPCNELIGAVNVNVVFVLNAANMIDDQAPTVMTCSTGGFGCADWANNDPDGIVRWNDFVDHFNLVKPDGTPAYYQPQSSSIDSGWRQKTIYFLPECDPQIPSGRTGGENFGVLAKVPVLVE